MKEVVHAEAEKIVSDYLFRYAEAAPEVGRFYTSDPIVDMLFVQELITFLAGKYGVTESCLKMEQFSERFWKQNDQTVFFDPASVFELISEFLRQLPEVDSINKSFMLFPSGLEFSRGILSRFLGKIIDQEAVTDTILDYLYFSPDESAVDFPGRVRKILEEYLTRSDPFSSPDFESFYEISVGDARILAAHLASAYPRIDPYTHPGKILEIVQCRTIEECDQIGADFYSLLNTGFFFFSDVSNINDPYSSMNSYVRDSSECRIQQIMSARLIGISPTSIIALGQCRLSAIEPG